MPFLQSNLSISCEPVLAIAKIPSLFMQQIIDIKLLASRNCKPIFTHFDNKKCELKINGFIFQLLKLTKNGKV